MEYFIMKIANKTLIVSLLRKMPKLCDSYWKKVHFHIVYDRKHK